MILRSEVKMKRITKPDHSSKKESKYKHQAQLKVSKQKAATTGIPMRLPPTLDAHIIKEQKKAFLGLGVKT